ncbi:putative aminopeptidase [Belliella baltica DSM 15883]|uniref:Putative aminopeptidase n=1 Tax=Belliella baltica (strain DSM 15883 / CIP 108006 / LMG 21964 / BA134) TaxID=866536 RepID=I3Z395_BELBD|nr:M28 family peptidase [Belliella baltica]AFL83713.1 putative aminopeptidase [Belliella baltica DSM 15883]
MKSYLKIALFFFILYFPISSQAQKINQEQLISDIKYLSSDELEGRKPMSEGHLKAQAFIKERFEKLGLSSQYDDFTQNFSFTNRREGKTYERAANIVGFIPGSESDKIIVVMGHYDHIGRNGDDIFNGADDNASGTVAMMALAEYFSKNRPKHSMMFVALDAEEMGMQGARALVADFPFPIDQVKLNINMDMVSRNDQNELYAVGTHHYPFLKPSLERASVGSSPKLMFGHDVPGSGRDDWTNASDHAQFHQKKVPFIYFGVEDHDDYHTPRDTFDNIQPEFFKGAVELILDCLITLDTDLLN